MDSEDCHVASCPRVHTDVTYLNFIWTAGGSDWDGTTLVDTNDSFKYDP